MSRLEQESGARIAFLTRYGEGLLPNADTVVQADDLVHVMLDPARRADHAAVFARRTGGALMRVAIAGAGKVGRAIARELLSNGHQVLLIDRSRPRPAPTSSPAPTSCSATPARSPSSTRPTCPSAR